MRFGLESVTVDVGHQRALTEVDVTVESGTVTAVIGADGAGKTTVAKVLVGLTDVADGRVRRPPQARLGYQPEAAGTWHDLTVAENLVFVATAHRMGRNGAGRIDSLLEITGLGGARDRLAANLSGGMRQKLAVAMAMIARPDLVVLDEPTTGLDPVSRIQLWRLLAAAVNEGTAVVATTSYLDEARRADHVVVLDEGQVLVAGTARATRASFPGVLVATSARPAGGRSWRRGRTWRTWLADGQEPPVGATVLEPDLEDVVMAAALVRQEGGGR